MSDAFETPKANDTREFDRWGRRLLPDPDNMPGGRVGWTRATTLASAVDDMWNIHQWELRMVAHGLTKREDLYALAFNMDPEGDKTELQQVCSDAMEAAKAREGANYGTALHGYVEQSERTPGKLAAMPARWRPYVDAYIAGMKRVNLTSAAVECIVVNKACKSAGKFDNLLAASSIALSNGVPTTYTIGDLKTEKGDFDYSQRRIAIQLAIYANAEWLWRPAINDYVPMPMVRKDIAYVIHLPVTAPTPEFSIWEVNIAAGWEAVQLALDVRKWRNRKGLMKPITNVSPGRVEDSRTDAKTAALETLASPNVPDDAAIAAREALAPGATEVAGRTESEVSEMMCARCGAVIVEPPNSWCPQCSMSATIEGAGLTVVAPASVADQSEHDEPGGTVPDEHGVLRLDDLSSWPARARAVRTREDASALWRAATDAGVWSSELEAIAKEALTSAAN